jgi:2-dehydro-3-deoxyphosphogluconate aldolase/(4S)-4-hydroxy-2-oxoglutarate aldolase
MTTFFQSKVLKTIAENPIVPVFYNSNSDFAKRIVEACYKGGVRAFEFTNRGEKAFSVFSEIARFAQSDFPDLALGIGTIFNKEQAKAFYEAGARFIVQPVTSDEVSTFCSENDILWVPGAGTVNEVFAATQLGAKLVKLFPGNSLNPQFVKALKGPMPNVNVMVTGGVEPTEKSITEWFKAGVTGVGIGSQLFPNEPIEKGEYQIISDTLSQLFNVIENLNAKKLTAEC